MSKMKKRSCIIAAVVFLFVCIAVFFRPLSLSGFAGENDQIRMVLSKFEIINGEPDINSTHYQEITAEQKSAILAALDQAAYNRTFATPFSNGALSGSMDRLLIIYAFDEASVRNIRVSSSGKIVVNEKTYRMKDAENFIEQIIGIVGTEG